ncbi:unnamed protein product, partial [Amoebophrya sp. A25]
YDTGLIIQEDSCEDDESAQQALDEQLQTTTRTSSTSGTTTSTTINTREKKNLKVMNTEGVVWWIREHCEGHLFAFKERFEFDTATGSRSTTATLT